MKQIVTCLALLVLLSAGCTKDAEIQERDYPLVRTLLTSTNESITFTGELLSKGSQEIISYGFVYDSLSSLIHSYNYRCDTILILGKPDDKFSVVLQAGFVPDKQYRVRSFVRTAEQYVVGTTQNFIFNGSKPVELYSFSPARGTIGDTVVIEGKYFSRSMRGNIVTFGNDTAKVIATEEGKIFVSVPTVPDEQICNISVRTASSVASFPVSFERWYNWSRIIKNIPGNYQSGTKAGEYMVLYDYWTTNTLVINVHTGNFFYANHIPGSGTGYNDPIFSCEDKAYFIFNSKNQLWEYDPIDNLWTRKQDLPIQTNQYIKPIVIGSKAYFLYMDSKEIWEYDATSDTWSHKTDIAEYLGYPVLSLSTGNKGYFCLKTIDSRYVLEYDPIINSMKYMSHYPGNGIYYLSGFFINGKIYIGLGHSDSDAKLLESDIWEYNPLTNGWKESYSFPVFTNSSISGITIFSEDGYCVKRYKEMTEIYKFDPQKR